MTAQVGVVVKELVAYLPKRDLSQNQEPQYHHLYRQEMSNHHHRAILVKIFYLITAIFHLTRPCLHHKLKA